MMRAIKKSFFPLILSRYYFDPKKIMVRNKSKYFMDPIEVSDMVIRIISQHDKVQNSSEIKLSSSFEDLNINLLDLAEISVMVEKSFDIEFKEEEFDNFKRVNDIVESVATNYFART